MWLEADAAACVIRRSQERGSSAAGAEVECTLRASCAPFGPRVRTRPPLAAIPFTLSALDARTHRMRAHSCELNCTACLLQYFQFKNILLFLYYYPLQCEFSTHKKLNVKCMFPLLLLPNSMPHNIFKYRSKEGCLLLLIVI